MAQSFLGSEDSMVPLLLHTLPLALSAGVAAYAISARWITFESVWSVVLLAAIIIGGTTAGGVLQDMFGVRPVPAPTHSAVVQRDLLTTLRQQPASSKRSLECVGVAEAPAIGELLTMDPLAVPDLTTPPPVSIPPLKLVPNVGGVLGIVATAINQLLGFVVAYQPRVFLASILAGGWTGWRWHQRLNSLRNTAGVRIRTLLHESDDRRAA